MGSVTLPGLCTQRRDAPGMRGSLFLLEAEFPGIGEQCSSVSFLKLVYKALQTEGLHRQTLLRLVWRPEV